MPRFAPAAARFTAGFATLALVAGCVAQPGPSGGGTLQPPAGTSPASATAVSSAVSGSSMIGQAISGDLFCTYYAPDGTVGTVMTGGSADYGTWQATGDRLCQTVDGIQSCSRVTLLPRNEVELVNLDGSGGFTTSAALVAGNECGV